MSYFMIFFYSTEKVVNKIKEPEKKPLPPPIYPSVLPRGSA